MPNIVLNFPQNNQTPLNILSVYQAFHINLFLQLVDRVPRIYFLLLMQHPYCVLCQVLKK